MTKLYSVIKIPNKEKRPTWRLRNLPDRLVYAFKNQLFTDAEIQVGNRIFKVHKCILACFSPVLAKIFYNKKNTPTPYNLDDIHPDGFQLILRMIYYSTFREISTVLLYSKLFNFDNAENVLYAYDASVKLEMPLVKEELLIVLFKKPNKLKNPLCMNKFWKLLKLSLGLDHHEITKKLLTYAKTYAENVFEAEDFYLADIETIKLVFSFMNVPEYKIFEGVAKWCDIINNWSTVDILVQDLLTCVNFLKLSPKEFYEIISTHEDLMSNKDALDILMHLSDPTVCSLPTWCSSEEPTSKAAYQNVPDVKIPNPNIKKTKLQGICVEKLKNGQFADVFLADKETTKKLYPAQKLILVLGSSIFENELCESSSNVLYIDATSENLENMLRCFYGLPVKVSPKSWISTLKTFDIALEYGCSDMQLSAQRILKSITLTPNIFWTLMDQERILKYCSINKNVLLDEYLQLNAESILQHEMFFTASMHFLIDILKCNSLNMSEYNILQSIGKWVKINCVDFSSVSKELLKYIRFKSLTAEEFYSFIKEYNTILSQKDALDIFSHLFCKESDKILPDWCYNGRLRGLFYRSSTKIGTMKVINHGNVLKGISSFRASYTIKLLNQNKECKVQYLELAWKVENKKKKYTSYKCNIKISFHPENAEFSFSNIDVPQQQRIMVPVFFPVTANLPEVRLDISITMGASRKLIFPVQKELSFRNIEIKADTGKYCLNDAIVDDSTSEQVNVPSHLLTQYPTHVIPTEKWCQ